MGLVSLKSIKFSFYKTRKELINFLKNLELTNLNDLEKLYNENEHSIYKNLFILTRLYQHIDEIFVNPDNPNPKFDIIKICKELVREEDVEKAIEVAHLITSQFAKDKMYEFISKSFFSKGKVNESLEVAHLIISQDMKDEMYEFFSKNLYLEDNVEQSLKVANMVQCVHRKKNLLYLLRYNIRIYDALASKS